MSLWRHLRTADEVLANHNLKGRNAIVTGASQGIGFETARALAAAGANVVIAARSVPDANAAAETLRAGNGGGAITAMHLDLADLESVRAFVADVSAALSEVHFLVCNAGVMATPASVTADGFELQLGTNYIGHHALCQYLLPVLKAQASPVRIVVLTSMCHKWASLDIGDLDYKKRRYSPWLAYASQSWHACCLCESWRRDWSWTSSAISPWRRCIRA